jgi:hypothetical protein
VTTDLATRPPAPPSLFGTDDPAEVIARAQAIAAPLAEVIRDRGLFATIHGREHVTIEGWTLLGSMVGVFPDIESTDRTPDGWEARASAIRLDGSRFGAVEAQCTRSEPTWRDRDDFALRSMAQTRAASKALKYPLGFIMKLAGYDPTPAEEFAAEAPAPRRGRPTGSAAKRKRDALRAEIVAAAQARGMGSARLADMAADVGVTGGEATIEQMAEMLRRIEEFPPLRDPAATEAQGQEVYP